MPKWNLIVTGLIVASLSPQAPAQLATQPDDALAQRVSALVRELDDGNFATRQAAALSIEALPGSALPVLEQIARDPKLSAEQAVALPHLIDILRTKYADFQKAAVDRERQLATRRDLLKTYQVIPNPSPDKSPDAEAAFMRLLDALQPPDGSKSNVAAAREALTPALQRDPDCPAVLILAAELAQFDNDVPRYAELITKAWPALKTADVAPSWKFVFYCKNLKVNPVDPWDKKEMPSHLAEFSLDYLNALHEENLASTRLFAVADDAFQVMRGWIREESESRSLLIEPMQKLFPNSAVPSYFEGMSYLTDTLPYRRQGWNQAINAPTFHQFQALNAQARAALESAWKLNPADPRPAIAMITVVMGEGDNRADMELWFKRAMAADPSSRSACSAKLQYLTPEWHGSRDDMFSFARDIVAQGDYEHDMPMILRTAHEMIGGSNGNDAYYQQREVWTDYEGLYEEKLKRDPDNVRIRSMYAKDAARAEQWAIANREFQRLGNKLDVSVFGSGAVANYTKRKAQRNAEGTNGAP